MISSPKMRLKVARLIAVFCICISLAPSSLAERITAAQTYQEAYDLGFLNGSEMGIRDYELQRVFDLRSHKDYRKADRGYEKERHQREVFLIAYRRGYEDGYEDGYRPKPEILNRGYSSLSGSALDPSSDSAFSKGASLRASEKSILATGTEFEVELLDTLSTRFNQKGDVFRARVFRPIHLQEVVVIPEGTHLHGRISYLKRSGRVRGRAQISLRFEEFRFLDGRTFPVEVILIGMGRRSKGKVKKEEGTIEGSASKGKDIGRIGQTSSIGALIGLMAGGKSGAGIGALGGAAVGLGRILLTRGKDAQIKNRTRLRLRLIEELKLK